MARTRRKATIPFRVSPMLATLVPRPFHRADWLYEEKYDGIRILSYKEGDRPTLLTRNDKDRSKDFPDIVAAIQRLSADTLLLDGEIVVFDEQNVSRFQLLQRGQGKPRYVAFDCLYADGQDLRRQPLFLRRKALEKLAKRSVSLQLSSALAADGRQAFRVAKRRGLEGLIAKNLHSTYVERRSNDWLKVKVTCAEEFVIGGFTAPTGSRKHFGALLLGVYERGKLQYAGKVGTGFDQGTLSSLRRKFQHLLRRDSPFARPVRETDATFLSPQLVAQASFTEWTKDGKLRHPVFLGLCEDKQVREVIRREH